MYPTLSDLLKPLRQQRTPPPRKSNKNLFGKSKKNEQAKVIQARVRGRIARREVAKMAPPMAA